MVFRSAPSRIAVTLALPAAALLTGELLWAWVGPADLVLLAAAAGAAWMCGTRHGVAALLLSALALNFFFLPLFTRLILFLGAGGLLIGLIHRLRATEAELRESDQRYRSLAELIPFGAWTADSRGHMTRLSESFLKTFGTTMEQCKGLGWIHLVEESERPQVLAEWRKCVKSGYFWDYEYHLRGPSGHQYVVLSRGVPVSGTAGKPGSWVGIHLDITEHERTVAQRVEQARDLARFNAELEQFAYVSAHDLQEPLRMIASYLQLLSRRYQGKLDDDADVFIGYAVEGAERLRALLQDLLTLQQIGKGNRLRVRTPLMRAVEKALASLADQIAECRATITYSELPELECEENSFVQLFTHLIENSLKYCREGVPPEIAISAIQRKPALWEIRVQDNGQGVPEEYRTRIFDVFQRLHPRKTSPGTGIGLAICKKIVEVHGGQIWVEAAPGGPGSTFCFTVPSRRAQAA